MRGRGTILYHCLNKTLFNWYEGEGEGEEEGDNIVLVQVS